MNSLPAVLMTSSSCEPQGAMIGESSDDEACCEAPAVCVYGPTPIASKVQNPGVARALPRGMSLNNELWVPPQGFWGKVKRWDGQHGGRVANAAVWQRSQSTGFGGKRERNPPSQNGRECGRAHHILGHSRILLQNQLFRGPYERQLPMDIDGSSTHSRGDRGAMAVAALGRPGGCGGRARQCALWTSGRGPSAAPVGLGHPRWGA